MFVRGSLSTMSVSEVLQWIEQNRKSGTLQIETVKFWKKLYFREGFIFFASSNREGERLGQFLIRKGLLTEEDLRKCLAHARQAGDVRKLSEVLVELGHLSQAELLANLTDLIQEIVYDSFLYQDGEFEFRDGQLPAEVLTGFSLSPQEMAMEGLRRLDEYLRDQSSLPDENMVLEPSSVGLDRIESVLGPEGREVFLLVDGVSTANEVLERCELPVHRAQALLLALLTGGAITPRPAIEVRGLPAASAAAGAATAHPEPDLAHPEMLVIPADYEVGALAPTASAAGLGLDSKTAAAADQPEVLDGSPEQKIGPPDTQLFPCYSLEKFDQLEALDAEEGFVLSRITDRCTVRELLQVSGTGRERGYQILWSLIRKGYVQTRRQP